MARLASPAARTDCPVCYRGDLLVLAVTARATSLYCLGCERRFVVEALPDREDAMPALPSAAPRLPVRLAHTLRALHEA